MTSFISHLHLIDRNIYKIFEIQIELINKSVSIVFKSKNSNLINL